MKIHPPLTAKKSRGLSSATLSSAHDLSMASSTNGHDDIAHSLPTDLIATEAYLLAAQRGFSPGHELDDLLAAEALVELRIRAPAGPERRST